MSRFDLIVRGGTVVSATGQRRADVGISDGRVVALERTLASNGAPELGADGLLVLPGVVDVHTHTRIPSPEKPERFFQDSVAAAYGGTTTFLSFNNPGTGISQAAQRTLRGGIEEWLAATAGESAIDFGLSAVITAQQQRPQADLSWAVEAGIPTFKAFMVYDFGVDKQTLARLMARTADLDAMVEVHCEDRAMLEAGIAAQLVAGRSAPRHHADSRPPSVEGTGTRRAIQLARVAGAQMYAVHLSCAEAVQAIREAKTGGQAVYAETCPHFLALDASRYDAPDEECISCVVSPPLRERCHGDALWAGVVDGTLDVIATDHVPHRMDTEKRFTGQPFTEISNGAPGIETLLSVVFSEGVARGRITLERMVDVLSSAPARLFGLGSKGAIEVGRDADLVIFDPAARRTLRAADLHHTSDYTPYEGMAVAGAVRDVLVRGEPVIREGTFVGERGFGRFQERQLT